jgi:methionyl aminopeptidase
MRRAGRAAMSVLRQAAGAVRPGVTTGEIDRLIGEWTKSLGAKSAFLGYRGFPCHACISVNEEVIHGIGGPRMLRFGDLVKLDVGVRLAGFVGDVAMTVACGGCGPDEQRLLDATSKALREGIRQVRAGASTADIGLAVQTVVEGAGLGVIRDFCGHGVGRSVHEEPQVPNYADASSSVRLKAGVTIAIEPMVAMGSGSVRVLDDGWTVVTRDKRLAAHFEHTVLVMDGGHEILTDDGLAPLY